MSLCERKVFVKILNKELPCVKQFKHNAGHPCVANLIGQTFGRITVLRKCSKNYKNEATHWIVIDQDGLERSVAASSLLSGTTSGKHCLSGLSKEPEYKSVAGHFSAILGKRKAATYKGMVFYDGWNPKKGGSYLAGYLWILKNLGKRPGPEWSLDIIKHEIGFVPGNLRWALRNQQIENRQHRTLGKVSDKEFEIEAKRRGYVKEKK